MLGVVVGFSITIRMLQQQCDAKSGRALTWESLDMGENSPCPETQELIPNHNVVLPMMSLCTHFLTG